MERLRETMARRLQGFRALEAELNETKLNQTRTMAIETSPGSSVDSAPTGSPDTTEIMSVSAPTFANLVSNLASNVSSPTELPGSQYRVGRALRVGDGSSTHEGSDRVSGNPVVIRIVSPDEDSASADGARPLSPPSGFVSVLERGTTVAGLRYLVMPLVEGISLDRLLCLAGSPIETLLHAFRRACARLADAHRCGLVHGDLGPSRLRLTPGGEAMILDWGLSRTSAWMAPEQVRSEDIADSDLPGPVLTAGTDIFALGVVLYQILAGITPVEVARSEVDDPGFDIPTAALSYSPPPPSRLDHPRQSRLDPDRLQELDRITLRCLQKDPDARHASAVELLDDLDGV